MFQEPGIFYSFHEVSRIGFVRGNRCRLLQADAKVSGFLLRDISRHLFTCDYSCFMRINLPVVLFPLSYRIKGFLTLINRRI